MKKEQASLSGSLLHVGDEVLALGRLLDASEDHLGALGEDLGEGRWDRRRVSHGAVGGGEWVGGRTLMYFLGLRR